ncbi:MAG: oligosaccharide flippase family protein [Roseovarius sp.]|nr:oligosaccharide flippase family protein [Roseovarius sp.]
MADPVAPISLTRSASVGMVWVTIALVFAKALSFLSQIVLGHALAVETYALFGLAMSCMSLIAGFQSPSVSKALIQNTDRFEELFPGYSAFAFQFGLLGSLVLLLLAALFQHVYEMPYLFAVLCVTSLSVPFLASNTTLNAGLSVKLRFRELNVIEIKRSFLYYCVLVSAALLGAEGFSMAIALVTGAVAAHLLLRRNNAVRPCYFVLNVRTFFGLFVTLRWVLLAAFLTALAMRSDFFVLGKMLSVEQIGFYSFGFMLMTSLTIPVSAGITQVLMPIFARLQGQMDRLRNEVLRFSSAITILGGVICIVILGLSSVLVHLIWGGKWDGAQFVINVLALAMPFRFLATLSGVGLEALGRWRLRNGLLIFEALLLAACAAIGASLAGMDGAIIGVIGQRILSGFMGFAILGQQIELSKGKAALLMLRLYSPFVIACVLLFVLSPVRHGADAEIAALGLAAVETLGALLVFGGLSYWWNRTFLAAAAGLILSRVRRR